MEEDREQVVSSPTELRSAEERMLGTELVLGVAARPLLQPLRQNSR
jgi:hypothetical protein